MRPEVVLVPSARIAGLSTADPVATIAQRQAIVIDIGRRLRLEPGQQLTVPVDLRRYQLAGLLEQFSLDGMLLNVRALSNVVLSAPALGPTTAKLETIYSTDMLGMETEMPLLRIEGVKMSTAWLEDSLAAIVEPDTLEDVHRMAMLSRWLEKSWRMGPALPPEARAHLEQVSSALVEAFPKLAGPEQAWFLVGDASHPVEYVRGDVLDRPHSGDGPRKYGAPGAVGLPALSR